MKRLKLIFTLTLAALSLSGCEAFLDTILTEPIFSAGEVWYDGQTYQIVKLSTCEYIFEDDSEFVTIEKNEKDKFIAKVNLSDEAFNAGEQIDVKITAKNAEDDSVEPYEQTVKVMPWALAIYDKDNKIVDKMKLDNGDYTIKMIVGLRVPIPAVLYGGGLNSKDNYQSLNWVLNSCTSFLTVGESSESTVVVTPTAVGSGVVKAILGTRTVELPVEVEM